MNLSIAQPTWQLRSLCAQPPRTATHSSPTKNIRHIKGVTAPNGWAPAWAKNKAPTQKDEFTAMAVAFGKFTPEFINELSPAQILRLGARVALEHGLAAEAMQIAKDAAPYFDAKLAPIEPKKADEDRTIIVKEGLPEDARQSRAAAESFSFPH